MIYKENKICSPPSWRDPVSATNLFARDWRRSTNSPKKTEKAMMKSLDEEGEGIGSGGGKAVVVAGEWRVDSGRERQKMVMIQCIYICV